jgi:hypothetical protein
MCEGGTTEDGSDGGHKEIGRQQGREGKGVGRARDDTQNQQKIIEDHEGMMKEGE